MQIANIVETDLEFTSLSPRYCTDMIVIHHTGAAGDWGAEQIHEWHQNQGWAGIGYHFVVRKDGTVERGRPIDCVGSHAYGENYHTIGIHCSGDFNEEDFPVDNNPQMEMLAMLIANIANRYGITISRDTVVGHGELMSTDCPGTALQNVLDIVCGKANFYLTH